MKKLLICVMMTLFLVGCGNMVNTPSKKVENYLAKYQKMDDDVLTQLDIVVDSDTTMDESQKEEYKELMKKQYQNFSYKIKDEDVEDDKATVDVEIEVYDYKNSLLKASEYYAEHKDEFSGDDEEENNKKYTDYKIKQLKDVKDKISYDITFNLTKEKDEWKVSDLSDSDRQKIHGLY